MVIVQTVLIDLNYLRTEKTKTKRRGKRKQAESILARLRDEEIEILENYFLK